jgi:hypothetical protein
MPQKSILIYFIIASGIKTKQEAGASCSLTKNHHEKANVSKKVEK